MDKHGATVSLRNTVASAASYFNLMLDFVSN
jgi:hypothetical protein